MDEIITRSKSLKTREVSSVDELERKLSPNVLSTPVVSTARNRFRESISSMEKAINCFELFQGSEVKPAVVNLLHSEEDAVSNSSIVYKKLLSTLDKTSNVQVPGIDPTVKLEDSSPTSKDFHSVMYDTPAPMKSALGNVPESPRNYQSGRVAPDIFPSMDPHMLPNVLPISMPEPHGYVSVAPAVNIETLKQQGLTLAKLDLWTDSITFHVSKYNSPVFPYEYVSKDLLNMLRFQIPAAYGYSNSMYTLAQLKLLSLNDFYAGLRLCCKVTQPTDCLTILQKAKCFGTSVAQLQSYFEFCFRGLNEHYTDLNEIGDAQKQKSVTTYIWSKIAALRESNLPLVTKLSWRLYPHRSSVHETFIQAFLYLTDCQQQIESFESSGLLNTNKTNKQPVAPINARPHNNSIQYQMGNKTSSNTVKPEEVKEIHECIICFEGFPDPHELHVQCFICKKYTHRQCFHKYLESAGLTYCKCAYCRQVGTTMTSYVDTMVSAANGAFWR